MKLLLTLLILVGSINAAFATADGCAVVLKSPDGFLALRQGPGIEFGLTAKLRQGDLLYVDTAQCETFGDKRNVNYCKGKGWTHVISVHRIDGASGRSGVFTQGWVSDRYVQWFHCPE